MKEKNQSKGFIVPVIIGIIAVGGAIGVWYTVEQERKGLEDLDSIDQENIELFIASQVGVTVDKIQFVSGSSRFARFTHKDSEEDIFVKKNDELWQVVEPRGEGYSCEQLRQLGFPSSFLFDCQTRYEQKPIEDIFSDDKTETIIIGFLQKIDECAGCVLLTTEDDNEVVFLLKDDFDDGDFVAVNIPDDEIVSVNGQTTRDELEIGEDNTSNTSLDTTDNAEEDIDNNEGGNNSQNNTAVDESGSDRSANIVEEIVDAEDVDENPFADDLDEQDSFGGGFDNDEPTPFDEFIDDDDNNDTVVDDNDVFSEDDQDIINFFDIDSTDQNIQVVGDPSEDRQ